MVLADIYSHLLAELMGPYYCGLALPWVAVGDYSLQIWRVVTNVLNRQSLTPKKRWSSSLGVGQEVNNFSPKKKNQLVMKYHTSHSEDLGIDGR
jgi:hypothetical protein